MFDESFSLKMTEFSFVDLWKHVSEDTHPPLSFILLKIWGILFGTSMFATRMFGVTFGITTIIGAYLFVKEAYSSSDELGHRDASPASLAALLTAAMIALSPLHISWSLIARMYSLGTTLTAFSSWFLMRALHKIKPGMRDWVLFTITTIALAYTHHFGLFIIAGQYCFAAGYLWFHKLNGSPRDRLANLKPVFISALIFFWVWQLVLLSFLDQTQRVNANFYTQPFQLRDVGHTFYQLFIFDKGFPQVMITGLIIAQAVFLGLVLLLLGRRPADIFIFIASTVTFLMAIIYSLTSRNVFKARYFMFAQILLFTAAAILICRIPNKFVRNITIVAVLGGMAFCSHWNYQHREMMADHPGMAAALTRYDSISKSTEPLIVCNPLLYTTAITCTKNRKRVFTYTRDRGQEYPFYQGSSVMLETDYVNSKMIDQMKTRWIWTLDESRWLKTKVPVSQEWKKIGETHYPDFNCELVLRLYERKQNSGTQQKIGLLEID
ncbi:glycosyltransferase family 39 protein [Gimesia benthica]|uniref:glycosyltransferase family 39 protein n=1 Tax=Gimesia benthica TaxID=2608982 RepID=UPI001884FC24|nr:glycosyltransferase family 39 protein [Gimesia benthica]